MQHRETERHTERQRETEDTQRHTETEKYTRTQRDREAIHMSAQYVPTDVAHAEVLEDHVAGVMQMHRCRVQEARGLHVTVGAPANMRDV